MASVDPPTTSDADDLIPAEAWYEPYLRFALYLGAAFQMVCILAVIAWPPGSKKPNGGEQGYFDSEVRT